MTDRQKQHLLGYLGYYSGQVDGIWGRLSEEATRAFQRSYGLEPDGVCGVATEKALRGAVAGMIEKVENAEDPAEDTGEERWWSEIRWFRPQEFACKCGMYHAPYCDGFPARPQEQMVRIADALRERLGVPVTIVSGLRCPQHNKDSGGVENSQHMDGTAADVYAGGVSPERIMQELRAIGGVRWCYHIQGSSNVHFDVPRGA